MNITYFFIYVLGYDRVSMLLSILITTVIKLVSSTSSNDIIVTDNGRLVIYGYINTSSTRLNTSKQSQCLFTMTAKGHRCVQKFRAMRCCDNATASSRLRIALIGGHATT